MRGDVTLLTEEPNEGKTSLDEDLAGMTWPYI